MLFGGGTKGAGVTGGVEFAGFAGSVLTCGLGAESASLSELGLLTGLAASSPVFSPVFTGFIATT